VSDGSRPCRSPTARGLVLGSSIPCLHEGGRRPRSAPVVGAILFIAIWELARLRLANHPAGPFSVLGSRRDLSARSLLLRVEDRASPRIWLHSENVAIAALIGWSSV